MFFKLSANWWHTDSNILKNYRKMKKEFQSFLVFFSHQYAAARGVQFEKVCPCKYFKSFTKYNTKRKKSSIWYVDTLGGWSGGGGTDWYLLTIVENKEISRGFIYTGMRWKVKIESYILVIINGCSLKHFSADMKSLTLEIF